LAEKSRYPQIPGTVWWGVRAILNKTPNVTVNERLLAIQLNVQEVAAKQYIAELIFVGILNEDLKATPLANKWRLDGTYKTAIEELNQAIYPQGLRDTAPQSEGDRQKAISWFQHEGLGQGAARNKAATYFLLGTQDPNEAPPKPISIRANSEDDRSVAPKRETQRGSKPNPTASKDGDGSANRGSSGTDSIPLNVNVQIHISADAGSEQIESIFSAMRRYLYDKQTS
jgi:hypothetical protein